MKRFNVLDYGLVADGETLNTKALQALIEIASKAKGEIYFPRGKYVLSTGFLRDYTNIRLAKGAYILGANSFYDYAPQEEIEYPIYQDQSHTYFDCSMFVGRNVNHLSFSGQGVIDMRSIWDEDNVRDIVHRGPKCIALKECDHVVIKDLTINNVTDLAVYYAGCNDVLNENLKLHVYIDGLSPDNSKNVIIRNCFVEAGDDAIVFKSSYTLNRLDICKNILVENCVLKSRCNAIKFGTESNGGYEDITCRNIEMYNSRITGIAVESVDGAVIKNISFKDIVMRNVGSAFFVHIGTRMRGPKELSIGSIDGVHFENIKVLGPYHVYKCMPWNYVSFVAKDYKQFPGFFSKQEREAPGTWQITSNCCGLDGHIVKNISFKNIYYEADGGVTTFNREVPDKAPDYPEIYAYGRVLPAKSLYFRYVDGITIENFVTKTLHRDTRQDFIFDSCTNVLVK